MGALSRMRERRRAFVCFGSAVFVLVLLFSLSLHTHPFLVHVDHKIYGEHHDVSISTHGSLCPACHVGKHIQVWLASKVHSVNLPLLAILSYSDAPLLPSFFSNLKHPRSPPLLSL
jgi:hypothetical protein